MSNILHSYPKVWALGHGATKELLWDPVLVEEKVDGSQFSFGVFSGELKVRSKGKEMDVNAPEKMFELAVATVKLLHGQGKLTDGWTYRCEYLQKRGHNVLTYDRVPLHHIILFDVNTGEESYLSREAKETVAIDLGLEIVPLLFQGKVSCAEDLKHLLEMPSILGGHKVEGIVVKNYERFGKDKKALLGKYVREDFKEAHAGIWGESNPGQMAVLDTITAAYRTSARWDKAIQRLAESGQLEHSPKDIGKIIKEVPKDLLEECAEDIKTHLFNWAYPHILRGVNKGLAEYYKEKLAKSLTDKPKESDAA